MYYFKIYEKRVFIQFLKYGDTTYGIYILQNNTVFQSDLC